MEEENNECSGCPGCCPPDEGKSEETSVKQTEKEIETEADVEAEEETTENDSETKVEEDTAEDNPEAEVEEGAAEETEAPAEPEGEEPAQGELVFGGDLWSAQIRSGCAERVHEGVCTDSS